MRQKYICILVLLLTTACISFARSENKELAVEYIPAALRTNADAVVRYDSTSMQLLDRSNLRYRQKIAITILNGDGKAFGNIWESYSNLVKIKHIKATLFDANGKEIGTMKEKDLFDQSQFAFDIMYHSDARIKKFAFNHGVFPYTVVIDIEREFETTFFIPDWSPQPKYNVSVQHSVLSITYPQEQVIRHKSYLMPENARYDSLQEDYNTVMRWIVDDVKSFRPQPYAHAGDFKYPTVLCAALYFSLKDHEGNMKTWKELGKFVYTLNKERDQLPENKKLLVHQLIKDVPDLYGKVEKLYQYMQENTRYFANVYGLAGWQTYDAISVAQSGYGDCKGLTNYLKALLQEAGIPSYSTLVFAGSDGYVQLDPEFPTNSFNHVILCVPTPKDTIWVECTSKTLAAGYLGSFTQGRWALITSAEGGYLCKTPAYDMKKNYLNKNTHIRLLEQGQQQVEMVNTYSGLLQENLHDLLKTQSSTEVKEALNKKFNFRSYQIDQYKYQNQMLNGIPEIKEELNVAVNGMISQSGKRSFVDLSWLANPMIEIVQQEARTAPIVIQQSFAVTDTIAINIPEGLVVEHLPAPLNISYPFAKYSFNVSNTDRQILMIRHFEQVDGVFEASNFKNYQSLYKTIDYGSKAANIVLVRKE